MLPILHVLQFLLLLPSIECVSSETDFVSVYTGANIFRFSEYARGWRKLYSYFLSSMFLGLTTKYCSHELIGIC